MEIAKAAANAKNGDMLENFFRDMHNGTLHNIDVSDMVEKTAVNPEDPSSAENSEETPSDNNND